MDHLSINQILAECVCFLGALAHYGGKIDQVKHSFTRKESNHSLH